MKKYSGDRVAFLDLLTNTLLIFIMLFMVAFSQIRPESTSKVKKPKAEYVVTITWQTDNDDDVDIWTKDPLDNIVFFRERSIGLVHLDRDDRGNENDTLYLLDGSTAVFPYNQEIVTIRGFIPGEWIFNIHMFSKRESVPAIVTMRIDKMNPSIETVFLKTTRLEKLGQEVTVFRAIMDEDGNFTNVNEEFKSLTDGVLEQTLRHPGGGH
jgi:inorganic pyrophosphatase